ncbi:MFS transporter [Mycolicibacterium tokaiense]|uniref:MFS transporter n=1 Tax=Mycolicibacterium tokaiense TaxID=39695 RepID=UPI000E1C2F8E|nr:MFS transporter [Mycolicibacterium tokaiense]
MHADTKECVHETGVLANRTFRRLFAAQVVALLGTGLLTVALGLLAYDLAGDAAGAVLGTALAIKMVAYVVVAPLVSATLHRVRRRVLMVGADVVRAVFALLLPFVDQVWQIYVLIFVLQAASATFTPAFQAVIPSVLVREQDYTRGLSLSRLAYDLETLVSPVLAAALLSVLTYSHLFLGTVAGFATSAALVFGTAVPVVNPVVTECFRRRVTAGVRVMAGQPALRALMGLNMAVAAATALVVVNTVVYVHRLLDGSTPAVALLLACYGGGSMIVALALPRLLVSMSDRRVMLAGSVVITGALAVAAIALWAHPAAGFGRVVFPVVWAALGMGASLINTPSARLMRYHCGDAERAAVFAAQFSLSHACFFVTYPLAGWLGALVGQPVAAAALAVLAGVAAAVAARMWTSGHREAVLA